MNRIRITQLDGKLPNLALMRLSNYHKAMGDDVYWERTSRLHHDEPRYNKVYASSIFKFTEERIDRMRQFFPDAIIGGTGTDSPTTIEELIGDWVGLDYSPYPGFTSSIGFTQRGCRLSCSFCVVPKKEGKPVRSQSINQIWRGQGFPKHIHLLDNDFFSIKDWWQERIEEIRHGAFKICFSQGINIRVITDEVAAALATIEYRDDAFQKRRLYTAWDNIGEERSFFRGVDRLERNGVPPKHLMAYMLVGFDPNETWEAVHHRFEMMVARGIQPYPMVFDCRATDPKRYRALKQFQRWVVTGLYRAVPFSEYDSSRKTTKPRRLMIGHNGGPQFNKKELA
ncbi:hypothetical protein [Mesorhizobium sp.]|uniref:hypothetical protein n=1 Tax=Mesorhizobium sp. TaxID=1871066 RepID=UPI00257BAF30|nr:hypothetical protein [Mesorhizobium sp.]